MDQLPNGLKLFLEETEYAMMVYFAKDVSDDKIFILKQCSLDNQRDVKLVKSYANQLKNFLSVPLIEIGVKQ